MRVVLDTNVWLDWLVFDDPSVTPLKTAHRNRRMEILINAVCFGELTAVLAYPRFKLDGAQQKQFASEVALCTIRHDDAHPARSIALPRCADPDDQKFLELARDAQADWLITRDKALLLIRRRQLEAGGFRIGTPEQWVDA